MKKTDRIDEEIISILSRDARTSNREVARTIGLSDTAVRKRLKRLSSAGIAKITAVVHPLSSGYALSALVRLRTTPADARTIAVRAAEIESVSFSALSAGKFNVVALVMARDEAHLASLLHDEIRCWPGVHEITTVRITTGIKHRLDLIRIEPPGV